MNLWVLRDDKPPAECNCGLPLLVGRPDHSRWCATVRSPGGTYYYAGRDLEGHWFMGLEDALHVTYREAQRIRREMPLDGGRRLQVERARARVAA